LGWLGIRAHRSFDLLILVGTLVLPQLTAFPVKMIGWDPLDYTNTGLIRTGIVLAVIVIISVVIGLWWKPRTWLISAALFYAIFTVFYTTFFTNNRGFWTGMVGGLGYWLSQQEVQRGSQPLYYYALIQIPMYEYLAALGSLLAFYFGIRYGRFATFPGFAPARQPEDVFEETQARLLVEPALAEGVQAPVVDMPVIHPEDVVPADEEDDDDVDGPRRLPVLTLLLYWAVTALLAYSVAGEKMPWLTVHIALPLLLAAGWGLGFLVDRLPWRQVFHKRGLIALLLLPVFLSSAAAVLGSLLGATPPFQGNALEQLESTNTFVVSLVMTVASGAGIAWLLRNFSGLNIARLVTVVFFALLALLTARAAFFANYVNYDTAKEYLVYAHAARGPKDILEQVEEISQRTTGGKDIVVAYDADALYPYWWYFRDYPNKRWFTDNPTRDLLNAPLIIASEKNYAKLDSITKDNYVYSEYMRLWWPNQDYYNLTGERIWYAISNRGMRSAIFDIWLNRDYTKYAEQTNSDTLSLNTWQPSSRFRLYIRKDVVAQIWNYGAAPSMTITETKDPYVERTIELLPDASIGMGGTAEGQFNKPRGLRVAEDGSLYVADAGNNRIQHLSADGTVLQTWGTFADVAQGNAPGGTFYEPWDVALGPDGSVYVSDTWNHRVQKFTADGQFVKMWGYFGQAEAPEAFWGPRGLAVDSDGRVYVMDTGNKRVVIFDADGNYITQFGSAGMDPGQFDEPVGIALDAENNVYITDTWNQRIQVFQPDETGTNYFAVRTWDVSAWFGQSLDNKPFITLDATGNIFVNDPEGYRILEFDNQGNFLRAWGGYSSGTDGFGLASGVAIDEEGRVWASDAGNNRLLRFTLPAE
ncbi:MAG TPA: 6-bladed beta-propeller, partial [Anaerolineaceae bacterium]